MAIDYRCYMWLQRTAAVHVSSGLKLCEQLQLQLQQQLRAILLLQQLQQQLVL
jgi:hypothetical protein